MEKHDSASYEAPAMDVVRFDGEVRCIIVDSTGTWTDYYGLDE